MHETRNHLRELPEAFVWKLQNSVQSAELKKVLYDNYETIFISLKIKSFDAKMRNFWSSVKYLFFRVYKEERVSFSVLYGWKYIFPYQTEDKKNKSA